MAVPFSSKKGVDRGPWATLVGWWIGRLLYFSFGIRGAKAHQHGEAGEADLQASRYFGLSLAFSEASAGTVCAMGQAPA